MNRVEELARSAKAQASRRRSSKSIGQRDPSLRWPHLYDILRAKGYDKEKSARIANSRLKFRKKGRLQGLPYKQADNKRALKKLLASSEMVFACYDASCAPRKRLVVPRIVFACHSAACAPPPVGTGGSAGKGGGGKYSGLSQGELNEQISIYQDFPRERSKPGGEADFRELVSEHNRRVDAKKNAIFPEIKASEARGDSRPVSREEFQKLAREGQVKLDGMAQRSKPATGLDENWDTLKADSFAEVQNEWGGATINAHTGKALPQGADQYALTVKDKGVDTMSIPIGASKVEFDAAMDAAKERFRPILEREGHHLGVFRDDDVGRIDFDPVLVTPNLSDVHSIGAATRAIGGAYNFKDGNGYWPPHHDPNLD